jgi:hypothetical protein
MNQSKHGKICADDPKWAHARFCKVHGHHGILYKCDLYPPEVLKEIDSHPDADKGFLQIIFESLEKIENESK